MIFENGSELEDSTTVVNFHKLVIRDNAYIGPECYIDATGGVEIGEGVRMSFRCVILSNTHHIARDVFRRSVPGDRHRPVIIERGCWIGAHVTIYPGVVIREGCVINAGSVIMRSTDPNCLYAPPEAKRIKTLSLDGGESVDTPLKLRLGETYKNRAGDYIFIAKALKPTDEYYDMGYRFIDANGVAYFENGICFPLTSAPSVSDLVKRIKG